MSGYRGFGGGGENLPDPNAVLDYLRHHLKFILLGVLVVVGIVIAMGSVFTVDPEEKAVVLRFGKPLPDDYGPGLHFKLPLVDQVYIVPVERQHRIELGFRSDPGEETTVQEQDIERESLMLTGDLSLAHVSWTVLYQIKDIRSYLFNVKDPAANVRDVAMGAMRSVVGDYSLDEMLTGKFEAVAAEAAEQTQAALDEVASGVRITAVSIRSTEVPKQAKQAFHELNRSVSEVKRLIREAYAERKTIRGRAEQRRQTAIGEAESRRSVMVENARGEAAAFLAKLAEYREAPDITRQWMYLEAMSHVLSQVKEKIILDDNGGGGGEVLKLLPLQDLGLTPREPADAQPTAPRPPAAVKEAR